jgi:SAM-dependent methyltransferase
MPYTPYDHEFFTSQSDGSYQGAKEVLPVVFGLTGPRSMLDVGCGQGTWLAAAQELGVSDVFGVDGSYIDPKALKIDQKFFLACDLEKPLDLKRRFDLVISLEVGEHLAESAAQTFADNLVRHGSVILFSAAVPGQGGTSHINEQWPDFWAKKFQSNGYILVDCVRDRIWNNAKIPVCYRQNAFLYVDREFYDLSPQLAAESSRFRQMPAAVVHPELFTEVLGRPISTRRLLKETPTAVMRTMLTRAKRLMGR